mgnify:CR=1 FL=1|jgi:hypothetical protein
MNLDDVSFVKSALRGLRPTGPYKDFDEPYGYYLRIQRGKRSFILKGRHFYLPKLVEVGLGDSGIDWKVNSTVFCELSDIKKTLLSIPSNSK